MTLRGRVLIVTRDEPDDGPLALALERRGARVRTIPLVRAVTVPAAESGLPIALGELRTDDWLFLTSGRGVDAVRAAGVAALPPGVRVAAVGERTATAFTQGDDGGEVDVIGAKGAVDLARLLAPAIAGRRVLWPASSRAPEEAAEVLRAAGAAVRRLEAYRVESRPEGVERLAAELKAAVVDAICLSSPSAVDALPPLPENPPVLAAIGETTAAAIRAAGLPEPLIAPRPSFEALADVLAHRWKDSPLP